MNIFTSLSRLTLLLGAPEITLPTSPEQTQGKGNGKAKDKQKIEAKGKHGGHPTRSLEQGGKSLKKAKKAV